MYYMRRKKRSFFSMKKFFHWCRSSVYLHPILELDPISQLSLISPLVWQITQPVRPQHVAPVLCTEVISAWDVCFSDFCETAFLWWSKAKLSLAQVLLWVNNFFGSSCGSLNEACGGVLMQLEKRIQSLLVRSSWGGARKATWVTEVAPADLFADFSR